jgi:hypothetical protein
VDQVRQRAADCGAEDGREEENAERGAEEKRPRSDAPSFITTGAMESRKTVITMPVRNATRRSSGWTSEA